MAGVDNRFEYLLRVRRGAFDDSQQIRSRGLEGTRFGKFAFKSGVNCAGAFAFFLPFTKPVDF